MYDVHITNNYGYPLKVGDVTIATGGGTAAFPHWGTRIVEVPGMGQINFIDLGQTKLDPYTNSKIPWTTKTWGGVIRYRGLDAYFRYEGTGKVLVVVDQVGSVKVTLEQGGMIIALPDLTVT